MMDTIVAVATPPGRGALAVVRLSGPRALAILEALAPGLGRLEPRRATLARIVDPRDGSHLDRGLVLHFPAPHSYTGEEVVEISAHGGAIAPARIVEAALGQGARRAEPGEFTRRAYLHGKLDLLQAEAVADLVEGETTALHRTALHHLERGLSRRIGELRDGLVGLEALLIQHLDFPEEDEAPTPLEGVAEAADALRSGISRLLATAPEGEMLREGALTVLAGRPNAGKSSLYNALVGEERAIVTEEPGTTRDALEVMVSLAGYPFRLVDTAGLREGVGRVERLGIEVAERYLARARVILLCVEAGRAPEPRELGVLEGKLGPGQVVLVRTKADLRVHGEEMWERPPELPELLVSVESGEGLDRLPSLLASLVFPEGREEGAGEVPLAPLVTRKRQAEALRRAEEEVAAFAQALRDGVPAEVAAAHLRGGETALEEVVGVVPKEEVLDRLFSEFCIGK